VLAWIDGPTTWTWIGPDGTLECAGPAGGSTHSINLRLGNLTGPGDYGPIEVASYTRSWCAAQEEDCTNDLFEIEGTTMSCAASLTVAPVGAVFGSKLVGTFSCSDLVDQADPTRTVTIYEGSFTATMSPPPD
jgi:hypothetical protein